jgi:hypothetical protein
VRFKEKMCDFEKRSSPLQRLRLLLVVNSEVVGLAPGLTICPKENRRYDLLSTSKLPNDKMSTFLGNRPESNIDNYVDI